MALHGLADTSRLIGAVDGEQDTMLRLFLGTPSAGRETTAQARDDRLLRDTMVLCMAVALSVPRASSALHMQHFHPGELRGTRAVAFVCVEAGSVRMAAARGVCLSVEHPTHACFACAACAGTTTRSFPLRRFTTTAV